MYIVCDGDQNLRSKRRKIFGDGKYLVMDNIFIAGKVKKENMSLRRR